MKFENNQLCLKINKNLHNFHFSLKYFRYQKSDKQNQQI